MAYTTIDKPELYFNTKLYTGTGSELAVTGVGFQPDFVWSKNRQEGEGHRLFDSVRGATKFIRSNNSDAEGTAAQTLKSFDSDGVTIGTDADMNTSGEANVLWNWKAGTSFSNDASATGVGSIDSTGSKSTIAGFSIISFTGTESGTPSIAHGLSAKPEWILSRPRDVSDNWMVFHGSFSAQEYISLNTTGASASASSVWNSLPSSTVINMGDNAGVNDDGAMIMYAFHSVQGFSKFGNYTGNGSADGNFVYLGFKPAFILLKGTANSENWSIYDNRREGYNVDNDLLNSNTGNAEGTSDDIDLLSNGFKVRRQTGLLNDAQNYIYMAFAESPFVTSGGVPTTGR
jgi:hypothetical protein